MTNNLCKLLTLVYFLFSIDIYAKGFIELRQSELVNKNSTNANFTSYAEVLIKDKQRFWNDFTYSHDFSFRKYTNEESPLIALSEVYISYNASKNIDITIGRKKLNWNQASSFWAMGEIFASKGFNGIKDEEEGSTGLQMSYNNGNFYSEAIVSAVSIPSLNPGLNINNGTITAKSEWSAPPPSNVRFEGQDIPIEYNVDMPAINDLIVKESAALRLGYKSVLGDLSVFGGRKPEPNARVNATGYLDQSTTDKAVVNVKPFINMQNFMGVSWLKNWNSNFTTVANYEYINPDRGDDSLVEIEGFKIEPIYNNISYASFAAKWNSSFVNIGVHALKAFKSYSSTDATFAKRLRFEQAYGINADLQITESIYSGLRYQADTLNQDTLVSTYTKLKFSKKTEIGFKYQQVSAKTDFSYWSRFRGNDLWQVWFGYYF